MAREPCWILVTVVGQLPSFDLLHRRHNNQRLYLILRTFLVVLDGRKLAEGKPQEWYCSFDQGVPSRSSPLRPLFMAQKLCHHLINNSESPLSVLNLSGELK